jgi:hypothetical protein
MQRPTIIPLVASPGTVAAGITLGLSFGILEPARIPAGSGCRARFVCFKDSDGAAVPLVENSVLAG